MSTDRSARGGAGAFPPPITAMLSESSACSAPCEAPPTCALPPGTSNSQPGRADSHTAPPFAASRAPAIRSSAFGYSGESTRPRRSRAAAPPHRPASSTRCRMHRARARDPRRLSRTPAVHAGCSPRTHRLAPPSSPGFQRIRSTRGSASAARVTRSSSTALGLPQVNLCGAHVRTDHDLVARAPGLPEVRLPEVAEDPVERDDGGITIGEQLAVSVIRRHDHVCVADESLEAASGVEHLRRAPGPPGR